MPRSGSIDPRAALEAIGELADGEIDIADAALQLARVDAPDADWHGAREHLSQLAREAVALAEGVPADDLAGQAAALALLLAQRHDYEGDTDTYDDVINANLIRVIERRRGLPITLGILWMHAATAAGWEAHGVDFPAHFLVSLHALRSQAVIDPFHGGAMLDEADLTRLIRRAEGKRAALRPELFAPMPRRGVLLRLQRNVALRRLRADDVAGSLASVEDMLRIAPHEPALWREAALLHQQLGQIAAALRCLERFLALVPEGTGAARARAAAAELRARLN
jgi:regulator of sirC expression with transglutaminase-like and TPR domain